MVLGTDGPMPLGNDGPKLSGPIHEKGQMVLQFRKYNLRLVKNTHNTEHYSVQKEEKDNNI